MPIRSHRPLALCLVAGLLLDVSPVFGQGGARGGGAGAGQAEDPVRAMVGRLNLEAYKTTLAGLAKFGDRRQGTDRNRAATDWIEAQLKSYGCTNTERITYEFTTRQVRQQPAAGRGADSAAARGGNRGAGAAGAAGAATGRAAGAGGRAGDTTAGRGRGRGNAPAFPITTGPGADRVMDSLFNANYGRIATSRGPTKYPTARTGVNMNTELQPDTALRRINAQPDEPGPRQEVYCTKIGSKHPNEMYIVGAHMDGHGYGAAVNDDGSGTALVMELARVFSAPEVVTDRSIRFILWNNEETGLDGARAYVAQRQALQGKENPAGSGKYPEPKWMGMIQHDMMMWDHGPPGPDGRVSAEQRREADVNIEFRAQTVYEQQSARLAWFFRQANELYATDYPATVGNMMTNTDSDPFKDLCPTISLRENERGPMTGNGWNPTWHQPIDVMSTFSDKDFRLGLNAAQTTLSAVAMLSGATLRK